MVVWLIAVTLTRDTAAYSAFNSSTASCRKAEERAYEADHVYKWVHGLDSGARGSPPQTDDARSPSLLCTGASIYAPDATIPTTVDRGESNDGSSRSKWEPDGGAENYGLTGGPDALGRNNEIHNSHAEPPRCRSCDRTLLCLWGERGYHVSLSAPNVEYPCRRAPALP